jgi:prepilin-type N-terminal cleavage/methylation domain-containing protein
MRWRSDESGFSLVELLIALAILSLVVVTLTSTFGFAQSVFQLMSDAAYQLDDITLTRRLLVDALNQLSSSGATEQQTRVLGGRNGFTIFALGPRIFGSAGPITLKVEAAQGGGLAASWLNTTDGKNGTTLVRRIVASDYRVWLSYYAASTGWSASWSDTSREPALLRVEFARKESKEDTELALIMQIRRVRPVACTMRAAMKGCELE